MKQFIYSFEEIAKADKVQTFTLWKFQLLTKID